jgi:hypothetical protein
MQFTRWQKLKKIKNLLKKDFILEVILDIPIILASEKNIQFFIKQSTQTNSQRSTQCWKFHLVYFLIKT